MAKYLANMPTEIRERRSQEYWDEQYKKSWPCRPKDIDQAVRDLRREGEVGLYRKRYLNIHRLRHRLQPDQYHGPSTFLKMRATQYKYVLEQVA